MIDRKWWNIQKLIFKFLKASQVSRFLVLISQWCSLTCARIILVKFHTLFMYNMLALEYIYMYSMDIAVTISFSFGTICRFISSADVDLYDKRIEIEYNHIPLLLEDWIYFPLKLSYFILLLILFYSLRQNDNNLEIRGKRSKWKRENCCVDRPTSAIWLLFFSIELSFELLP